MADAVVAGWDALSRAAWEEALALLGAAGDDPEALEAAGVAHWWLDHADETVDTRERAYRLYRERGDRLGAARVAAALAWDSILFGGRTAVARGWLDRAARLLAEEQLSVEHAWLAVREAEVALASGRPDEARPPPNARSRSRGRSATRTSRSSAARSRVSRSSTRGRSTRACGGSTSRRSPPRPARSST